MMVGLTLGKYAPFHNGHRLVIQTACDQMDEVIVLVYDSPSVTDIPLTIRAQWIKHYFPKVKVIKGYGSPECTGMTPDIMKTQDDYIRSVLQGQKIDAFYSSEPYGKHVSESLGCKNVVVDIWREKVPISATQIRKNPLRYKEYVPSIIWPDLVKKVLFLGAPSTGKSTITELMAKEYQTVFMPEYGREYWEQHQENKRLTMNDLVQIGVGHIKRENEKIQFANKFLFTDTNALTTHLFSLYYHGQSSQVLLRLVENTSEYDFVFLCDEDIPYDDTWDRSGETNRHMFQRMYYDELSCRRITFTLLSGSLNERIQTVKKVLLN